MKRLKHFIWLGLLFSNFTSFGQHDYLEPVENTLDSYQFHLNYQLEIRRLLLKGFLLEDAHAAFLIIPSFNQEAVSIITKNKAGDAFILEHRWPEKNIWYSLQENEQRGEKNKEPIDIEIIQTKYKIDKESALKIQALYNAALRQIKYPDTPLFGADGTTFYFFTNRPTKRAGQTWSPREGTKLYELTRIGFEIMKLHAPKNEVVRLSKELNDRIDMLILRFEKEN